MYLGTWESRDNQTREGKVAQSWDRPGMYLGTWESWETQTRGVGCRSLNPGIFLGCTWVLGNPGILRQGGGGGGVGGSIPGSSWDVLGY